MAIALEPVRTIFDNTERLDTRAIDATALSDGTVLFGFGGSLSVNAVVYTATYDPGAAELGPVTSQVIPRNPAGVPASTLREIELNATPDGKAVATMHFFNVVIGDDTGLSLSTQIYDGTDPQGTPRPVNPGEPAQETTDIYDTVVLPDGSFVTFHSAPGSGFVNLSDSVWMTRFKANGAIAEGPVQVIEERVINTLINLENNPEKPDAVLMKNGNIGLVYKESNSVGGAVAVFQQLTPKGVRVGEPVQLGLGLEPRIVVLDSGRMVAVADEARILTAKGELAAGGPISFFPDFPSSRALTDVVAMGNGGFAVSWLDMPSGLTYARMFDGAGKPLTNPFLLTDTIGDATVRGENGMLAVGDDLMTFVVVGKGASGLEQALEVQVFDGAGSMGRIAAGNNGKNTLDGTGSDDILNGRGGRDRIDGGGANDILGGDNGNDKVDGGAGNDILSGGTGNDRLNGGDGADSMTGGDGRDVLIGGAGNDRMIGGTGPDVQTGGAGADQFVFASSAEGGDRITDFSTAEGDKIVLNLAQFIPGFLTVGATVNPTQIGLFFETASGELTFYNGVAERALIATLDGVTTLATTDLSFQYF